MRHLTLPDGSPIPALGLGTWRMGEARGTRAAEVAAVRRAIELGYRLIDSAEMYGDGGAETVVGQAIAQALRAGDVRRDELFVVSKVLPHNASRRGTAEACARSRQRLGLDRIDLYLLHWRGAHPLADTVAALQALAAEGAIGHWGVSNFDRADMQALEDLVAARGGSGCACNQVYFGVAERGPEFDLLPWLQARSMPLMAYSPIDQGRLAGDPLLAAIGAEQGCSAARVALAWVLARPGVVAIPKAVQEAHLRDNLAALDLVLGDAALARIDARHPPPNGATALAMT
jgi:diketogulonate reductase-like aldo/keto reductase